MIFVDAALDEHREHGVTDVPVLAPALIATAVVYAGQGRSASAAAALARAKAVLRPNLEPQATMFVDAAAALVAQASGDLSGAIAAYRRAESHENLIAEGSPVLAQIVSHRLLLQLELGEANSVENAITSRISTQGHDVPLAEADLLRRRGELDHALDILRPLVDRSDPTLLPCDGVHALLLTARINADLGNIRDARAALESALEVAEPDGLVAAFAMVEVGDLLAAHPGHDTAHRAFRDTVVDFLASRSVERARPSMSGSLTPSESRVLGYLPTNLTAREIADEMYLSVNTVKVHLRGIYQKLDAHNRTQAVQHARSVGLLAPSRR